MGVSIVFKKVVSLSLGLLGEKSLTFANDKF